MTNDIEHIDASLELLKRLEQVLDVYGAEPLKWPESDRTRLLAFIGTSRKAQDLFNEAQALDYVLDHNPTETGDVSELHAKILGQLPKRDYADNVTPLPVRKNGEVRKQRVYVREVLQSAVLLAASLIIGVVLGLTDFVSTISNLDHDENIDITRVFESDSDEGTLPPEEGFL